MAVSLSYDARRKVVLASLGDRFSRESLAEVQEAVRAFAAAVGGCDGILDLTAVKTVDIPAQALVEAARRGPVLSDHRRVIVAPHPVAYGLSRMFGTHQSAATGKEPAVVRTLAEALELLGIAGAPDFRPVSR